MKDILQPVVRKFLPYAKQKMGFDKQPSIILRTDEQNSKSIFGRTAHYNPDDMSIVLYVHDRHPKDILRSLAHELVHHSQNCRGEFDDMADLEEGYAQKNPHLRDMEEEAYKVGNLVFRDFEDMMKEKTIYREFLEKGETLDMSHEKWKNKELGTLLSESWGFGFNLDGLTEGGAALKHDNMDRLHGRHADPDRLREEEEEDEDPIEEGEDKKPDEDGDGVPDYADKNPGKDDNEDGDKDNKKKPSGKAKKGVVPPQFQKKKVEEAKLRAYIRKLIQESLKEG